MPRLLRVVCRSAGIAAALSALVVVSSPTAGSVSAKEKDGEGSAICKDGAWRFLVRSGSGIGFRNQGECVSYVVQGGRVEFPIAG